MDYSIYVEGRVTNPGWTVVFAREISTNVIIIFCDQNSCVSLVEAHLVKRTVGTHDCPVSRSHDQFPVWLKRNPVCYRGIPIANLCHAILTDHLCVGTQRSSDGRLSPAAEPAI